MAEPNNNTTDIGRKFIDPRLLARLDAQEEKDGVDLKTLPVGSRITVETRNSVYKIKKLSEKVYSLQGGKRWQSEPIRVFISGSTFGGSLLKIGWIGDGMNIELYQESDRKCIITSPVTSVCVEAPVP